MTTDLADQYFTARRALLSSLGFERYLYPIQDNREYYWSVDGKNLSFTESADQQAHPDDFEYGLEIVRSLIKSNERYTAAFVDDGYGERYLALFSNDKRVH